MPRACHVIEGLTYFLLSKGLAVDGDHPPRRTMNIHWLDCHRLFEVHNTGWKQLRNFVRAQRILFLNAAGSAWLSVKHRLAFDTAALDSTQSLSIVPCRRGDIQYSRITATPA